MFDLTLNNNLYLILFSFVWMLISNVFPFMFFVFPEIIITSAIYHSTENLNSIYIIFIFSLFWAIIWETISFFIGKNINSNFLYKYIKQDKLKKLTDIFTKHGTKSIITWKLLPWITWFVPVFFGFIQYEFKKFFLLNSIMILYSLLIFFILIKSLFVLTDLYLSDYKLTIFIIIIAIFIILHLFKNKISNIISKYKN